MAFGLTDKDIDLILSAIAELPEIDEVLVFGSRAMGNFKNGSDVDLAIKGGDITLRTVSRLSAQLNEELPLPYEFDVVDYAAINTPALKEHVDSFGKTLTKKSAE